MDEEHVVLDLTRPWFYVDFLWHSSGDPNKLAQGDEQREQAAAGGKEGGATETTLQVTSNENFCERFATSPHFVKIQQGGFAIE